MQVLELNSMDTLLLPNCSRDCTRFSVDCCTCDVEKTVQILLRDRAGLLMQGSLACSGIELACSCRDRAGLLMQG